MKARQITSIKVKGMENEGYVNVSQHALGRQREKERKGTAERKRKGYAYRRRGMKNKEYVNVNQQASGQTVALSEKKIGKRRSLVFS